MSASESEEWTGGCLCGAVRYRARKARCAPSSTTARCAARSPRRRCFRSSAFPSTASSGPSASHPSYRSSAEAERGFCPICGGRVSLKETVLGDRVQVSLGSLDRPGDVTPDDHVWTRSQLSWLHVDDDLPRYPRNNPAAPTLATGVD